MKTSPSCWAGLLILAWTLTPVLSAETVVLFGGTKTGDWDTARDPGRLSAEFSRSELAALTDPPALRWQFVPKAASFNDLFLRKSVTRPFSTVRVRLRNQGETFMLAAKVGDARGAEWTTGRLELRRSDDWRWIEFPVEQWKPAPWSAVTTRPMAFPLSYFTLIAFDVRPGKTYEIQVSRVEIVRPVPPVVIVHQFTLPQNLVHGQSYPVRLRLQLDKLPTIEGASLVFLRDKSEAFRKTISLATPPNRWKPGDVVEETFPVSISEYAVGGPYNVMLELGEAKVLWKGQRMDEHPYAVRIQARIPGQTTAAVRNHNGAPTLFINGTPHNGMAYAAYEPSVSVFRDFAQVGVNLFTFSATPTEAGYGLSKTTWTAPGTYDFSQLDQRVMMVLEANPQAYFFPRLYLHAPKWWSQQHPQDLVLMDPGDGKPVPFLHAGDKPAPSWTSPTWRKDTIEGLRRLIAHIEASPYADRCIGYHIASGTTEEWMMWGAE